MCGIFGILNTKKRKFDFPTFCTLGIANDTRGGDSCGIFVDGDVEYGVGTNKYFQVHFTSSALLKKTKTAQIVLGHDRKASVGSISEATAQPVVLKDKTGKTRYVLIHNGTVYNYEELAKKYIPDVDIKGLTDSQVLARIFYYKGYDCLSEYYGGAAFVAVDYRQPEPLILMWRGASKKTTYSKEDEEERPLWFVYDKEKGELVFSSISTFLEALRPGAVVYQPKANNLVKYNLEDGEVYIHSEHKRDDVSQSRKIETVTSYYKGSSYNYGAYTPGTGVSGFGKKSSLGTSFETSYCKFLEEIFADNLYRDRTSKEVLHGKQRVSKYGKLHGEKEKADYGAYEIYFFAGVALRGKKYFKFLDYMRKRVKLTAPDFLEKYPNIVRFFSVDQLYKKNGKWVKATKPDAWELYTGTFQPLGQAWVYRIESGDQKDPKVIGDHVTPFGSLTKADGVIISKIQGLCKSLMK